MEYELNKGSNNSEMVEGLKILGSIWNWSTREHDQKKKERWVEEIGQN